MKLFLGLIFILLDLEIKHGSMMIGLLPDFVGFFLVMKGLEEQGDPWRHLAFGLMLAGIVLFVGDLLNISTAAQAGFGIAGFAMEIVMLVLLWHLVRKTDRLRVLFPVVACIRVLCAGLGWIPLVGTVCIVANTVVAVCFLIAAYPCLMTEW